jgi:serine/threonine protein kinase
MKLRLTSKLGDGGFADVWRAKDALDRDVAVKIVREAGAAVSSAWIMPRR